MSIAFPIVPWGNGTNIYEVNVRQYTKEGTLTAFIQHIPRLHDMGIDVLWLMPLTPISVEKRQGTYGSYYAASSYVDIDPLYGTPDDFKELIRTAHLLGMKVMIDWVANHTGYDHQWTKQFAHRYRKDDAGNFTGLYGWVDVIDLNYDLPELRQAMIEAMQFWVREYDIDGFRCDMARTVPVDFWLEARSECDAIKPLLWLAECEIPAYHEVFDITYSWEWMRMLEKYMKGEAKLDDVKAVITNYAQYPAGARKLLFTSNHDENTYWGTEYEKYGVAAKAQAVFTCTWPGIPLIYSGQEKPNYKRLAFFEKDAIDWEGPVELHDFYKTLLSLRKSNKALQENASVLLLQSTHEKVLAYLCRRQADKVLVVLNTSGEVAEGSIDHPALTGKYTELFTHVPCDIKRTFNYSLKPGEHLVYYITKKE
ncbi:alpha-amylase family glycosyl hydrolase [Foetidibacter luteolus]|uniref:alpha-amylase family glycosyl hydrolase n=1 Tax=Foetidibacter luteolus TaxID=2608880 RepID=UPI00129B73D4|nr:alpha-amylase family glycosyl hydrolase [Foetidibacter luteolus]